MQKQRSKKCKSLQKNLKKNTKAALTAAANVANAMKKDAQSARAAMQTTAKTALDHAIAQSAATAKTVNKEIFLWQTKKTHKKTKQ